MAKILPGGLLNTLRGSLGGITFKGSPSGTIVTARALNRYHATPRGIEHTGYLSRAHLAWTAMPGDLLLGWESLARNDSSTRLLGTRKFTGRQLFFKWYLAHLHLNDPPPTDQLPPAPLFTQGGFLMRMYGPQNWVAGSWGGTYITPTMPSLNWYYQPMAIWFNVPWTRDQNQTAVWKKIFPLPGGSPTMLWDAADRLVWDQIGKPREFWKSTSSEQVAEQFVVWVKGHFSFRFQVFPGYNYPPTTIALVSPRPYRPLNTPAYTLPSWPATNTLYYRDPPPNPITLELFEPRPWF